MKTLLFLCSYKAPYAGNFVSSLKALEKELSGRGITCVYSFDSGAVEREWYRTLENEGRTLEPFHFGAGKLREYSELKRIVKKYNADAVYAHFGAQSLTGIFAALNPKIKVFWHIHSDFSLGRKLPPAKRLMYFVNYRILSHFVSTAAVSEQLAEKIPGTVYIPNGLAADRAPSSRSREQVRADIGVGGDEKLALMFAWSPEVKGLDIAAQAVKSVRTDERVILAVVCGREMNAERLPAWLSERTGISGNEDFLRFVPPVENVFEYFEACDFFISASRSEGFPSSVLECLGAERTCVSSDIPAVTSWAGEVESVYFFKSGDASDCARTVKRAVSDPPGEEALRAGAALVKERYSVENWCRHVIAFLDNTAKQ